MRLLPVFLIAAICCLLFSFKQAEKLPPSPLAAYSAEWNQPKYLKCNTASRTKYMSAAEKQIIYILNMARMNPTLFANTVVKQYPDKERHPYLKTNSYYISLLDTLPKIKTLPLLQPDSLCFVSARCHALYAGAEGYVGHERTTDECRKKEYFDGECCHYGYSDPLEIVLALLIDEDVPSLGHRRILLGQYKKAGVSLQKHLSYNYNTVIDVAY